MDVSKAVLGRGTFREVWSSTLKIPGAQRSVLQKIAVKEFPVGFAKLGTKDRQDIINCKEICI